MIASTRDSLRLAVIGIIALGGSAAHANPAFPGAEGFGANAFNPTPGVNYDVYRVTTLYDGDDAASMPGTLRNAVRESGFPASGRIVVFDVGGVINLTGGSLDIKNVKNLYIAGQTAPSPITLYGDGAKITSSSSKTTENIVLRHLTFRKGTSNGPDAFGFEGGGLSKNLILDHVSASWSTDEVLSVANNNTSVTVQHSIIADALVSNHAYGSLIRPRISSDVTFHHNLYANNASRNPRLGTYDSETLTVDFVNNVIYNSRDRAGYVGGSSGSTPEYVDLNYVGNYVVAGPATTATYQHRAMVIDRNADVRAFQQGNYIDADKQLNPGGAPNGSDTGWGMFQVIPGMNPIGKLEQMNDRFDMPQVATQAAPDAFSYVVNHAGNSWWNREAIDARIVSNVLNNTSPPNGVAAAAPNAAELAALLATPQTSRPGNWDTDSDGMPDWWEAEHGLNPAVKDHHGDFSSNGYTNLEQYINELGAFPAPRPIGWSGGDGRYALNGNWDTWQPSRFDVVNINAGKASIDAAGQHAGRLRIGVDAGSNGTVAIQPNGGGMSWLKVADKVEIGSGAGSTGRLELNGGMLHVAGSIDLNATGTLVLGGGAMDLNGGLASFNLNGGTIRTLIPQIVNIPTIISGAGGRFDTSGQAVDYSGSLGGAGALTKIGPGTLRISGNNAHEGGVVIEQGLIVAASPTALGSGAVAINGGDLRLEQAATAYANNQAIAGLVIASASTVDVTTNVVNVHYTGASPIADLQQAVRNGASSLAGAKILTTALHAGRTVGIFDNGSIIRVGYAAPGDSDMDGAVTISDMNRLTAAGFSGAPMAGAGWSTGDFDHDGVTTISDVNAVVSQNLINTGPYGLPSAAAMTFAVENAATVPTLFVDPATGQAILDTAGQALSAYQIQSRGLNGEISAVGDGDGYLTIGLPGQGGFLFTNSSRDEYAATVGNLPAGVYDLGQLFNASITGLPLGESFILSDLRFGFNGDASVGGNGVVALVPEPLSLTALLPLVVLRRRRRAA